MPSFRAPVNSSFVEGMDEFVAYHKVNMILGAATTVINLLLLFVLCASSSLRKKSEILIVLCLADGMNCFSICLMGLNRVLLYTEVIDTLTIPIRTSWECALEPWLLFRGYGDLWPPTVQLAMGVDRCLAVFNPISYNKRASKRKGIFFFATIICVTLELSVGYLISWSTRFVKVKYWCGRKAAFGNSYASFVYGMNIVCYLLAFVLTMICYFKSKYYMDTCSAKQHLARIRYQLMISLLSIVLISTPNGISLFAQYIAEVADAVAKTSTYLTCVNSAINIVVYLLLHKEFRSEFVRIIFRKTECTTVAVTITLNDKCVLYCSLQTEQVLRDDELIGSDETARNTPEDKK
ncbi:hypothetical protein Y032_0107g3809 [Ancylostoma ceylanicum]|uniref:G-protein coupled receptors family 1 profile domain-containing protein n=1 Tax=Ancylostoma ceylanicum TaxID=53326 RepID=A0A016TFL6_9BILA|nr:hypothetical protein Y032_0107g3809 [Ancylostoma ceylanicum]